MNCCNGWDEEITKSNFLENFQKGGQKDVTKNRNIVACFIAYLQTGKKEKASWNGKTYWTIYLGFGLAFYLVIDFTKKYSNIITATLFWNIALNY